MVKTYQNLQLLAQVISPELSILENRKYNQAGTMRSAEDYTHSSVPKRIDLCRKASRVVKRGLRKSSSLTNGIGRARNKAPLKEYGTEARGLYLSCDNVNASILDTPLMRSV